MFGENFKSLIIGLALVTWHSQFAMAGSITGKSESGMEINCDVRRSNADTSWCTSSAAEQIFNRCFVIVRLPSDPASSSCDWQSCGPIAFVGSKPRVINGFVVEYGISTPHILARNPPASWALNSSNGEVLPKFPFPRNYLTMSEFASHRNKCLTGGSLSNDVQQAICPIDKQLFDSNSYFACLKKQLPGRLGNNL
jgi:hypothetical protein